MPRGGRRRGKPGKPYPNRSDLTAQPVTAAPGQPYGVRGQQEQAQRVVPLPQQAPPQLTPLDAPTARPDEPITTGLSTGPGAGPEILGLPDQTDTQPADELLALYQRFPSDDLRRLIEDL